MSTFKLQSFSPVGYKTIVYPSKYCPLCRGELTEACSVCIEKNLEQCTVIKNASGDFYHQHCLELVDKKPTK